MKRRTFITTAAAGMAAAGGPAALARKPAIGGRTLDREFIRVGMLGLGPYSNAASYIQVINSQLVPPRTPLRVTAVWGKPGGYASSFRGNTAFVEERMRELAERNSIERFRWEYGVERIVDEPEAMMDDVDAVFVTDPEDSLRLARPFLDRGMPVYVDRPVAWSVAEARELVTLARANNTTLVAGSYLPWMPEVRALASRIDRNILQHYYIDGRAERFVADMSSIIETALMLSGGEVESCCTNGLSGDPAVDTAELPPVMVHLTYRKRTVERDRVLGAISSWYTEPCLAWMKVHMDRRLMEQRVLDTLSDNPVDYEEHHWLPLIMGISRAFEMGSWPETDAAIISKVTVLLMAHRSGVSGGEPVTAADVEGYELPRLIGGTA